MPVGDITACRIASAAAHNGFVAEIDIAGLAVGGTYAFGMGANNDPVAAKIVFTLTSQGYDAAGGATTIQRTIYGTQWVRKAYPDQATADEAEAAGTLTVRVSLSDFIYDPDTAVTVTIASGFYTKTGVPNNAVTALAVTNNSTLTYPKVIGRWAWTAYETVQADFLIETCCFHRHAKDGKPVAAVVYSVTDGTNTVTATVTAMTVSTRAGVGSAAANKVLVYAATIPITSFIQGAVLTANFTAYPWVGEAAATLDSRTTGDGFAQPDERLGPLELLCDKDATYGGGHAVVDAVNGRADATDVAVYATKAAADSAYLTANTNSYNTLGRALAAIKSWNNTNLSRNEPGGGVVYLTGTHDWPGTTNAATLGAQNTWATITRYTGSVPVTRASAIVNAVGSSGINTQRVKFTDVTIFGNVSTEAIRGTSAVTDSIWIDDCTLDLSTSSNAPFVNWKLSHATRNLITALSGGFTSFSTVKSPFGLIRGNAGAASAGPAGAAGPLGTLYAFLGNYNLRPVRQKPGNAGTHQPTDNAILAFNSHYAGTSPWTSSTGTGTPLIITHGIAYVQNVVELQDNTNWSFLFDDNDAASSHIIVWHNQAHGARAGIGYNDTGSVAFLHTRYSIVGNIAEEGFGNKDDTFVTPAPDGARTGAWPVGYHVGSHGNFFFAMGGTEEWRGEFYGLYTVSSLLGTWAFVDNASNDAGGGGDDTGNGDYHLGATNSGYSLMAAGTAVLPFDLEGTARTNAGGGSAGAFEMNPPAGAGGGVATGDDRNTQLRTYLETFYGVTAPADLTSLLSKHLREEGTGDVNTRFKALVAAVSA